MAATTNTWSPQTIGVADPRPGSAAFHLMLVLASQWTGGSASATPSACGPRHWGQFGSAGRSAAPTVTPAIPVKSRKRLPPIRHVADPLARFVILYLRRQCPTDPFGPDRLVDSRIALSILVDMDVTLARPPGTARGILWLGLACAAIGIPLYAFQLLVLARTGNPWYAPVLASVGVGFVLLAVYRRPNLWRGLALVLVAGLTAGEWWFLLSYTRLPEYTGPVAAGGPFPDFQAAKADGTPFTRADLTGDRGTALVFFRGHW